MLKKIVPFKNIFVNFNKFSWPNEHHAFVFVKPPLSILDKAVTFTEDHLLARGLNIVEKGVITAKEIKSFNIIDAHYAAHNRVAFADNVKNLAVLPSAIEKFNSAFQLKGPKTSWQEALEKKMIFTAEQFMEKTKLNAEGLGDKWEELNQKKLVEKIQPNFRAGWFEEYNAFALNAYYPQLRSLFTKEGATVPWYIVSFPAAVPWTHFRYEIIGHTNPPDAVAHSLRGRYRDKHESLGVTWGISILKNGSHCSGGPWEGVAEIANWTDYNLEDIPFVKAAQENGVWLDWNKLTTNPLVKIGKQVNDVYSFLEDQNVGQVMQTLINWSTMIKDGENIFPE